MERCDSVGIHKIKLSSDVASLVQYDEHNDIYICRNCKRTFNTIESWEDHHLYYHFKPIYECSYCNLRFVNIKTLANHVKFDHFQSCDCCTICKQLFFNITCFVKHMQNCHVIYFDDLEYFICRICTPWQRMNSIDQLLHHHETVHDPIFKFNFICHVCGKMLDRNKPMTHIHLEEHYKPKLRMCTTQNCFKIFPTLIELRQHVREDHPTKLLCERCFTTTNDYTDSPNLYRHLYRHEQQKHADQLELA